MSELIAPMLAAQSNKVNPDIDVACELLQKSGHLFEPKLDGVRAVAYITDGSVKLVNRRLRDISGRYPDVIEAIEKAYPDGESRILDGEVVCLGDNGQPEFSRIHQRDAISTTNDRAAQLLAAQYPATFYAFDLLGYEGDDWMGQPYMARRTLLERDDDNGRFDPARIQLTTSSKEGVAMLAAARQLGLEGLIAKPPASRYVQGSRSAGWVKLKIVHTISAAVIGYEEGKNARAGMIGALSLALVDGGDILPFGQCGTGMTQADLVMLKNKIDAGELLVIELELANVTKERKPRHPSFKGLRSDVEPSACTVDQLDVIPVI